MSETGTMQSDWDIVSRAFDEPAEECRGCEYYFYEYYTDIGASSSCGLGDYSGHDPRWCAAYDRIAKEMEDE